MQHQVLKYYQIHSNDDPGSTFDLFTERLNSFPCAFYKGKSLNSRFSEIIEHQVIILSRFIEPNKYMKINECQRSRSFFDLCP